MKSEIVQRQEKARNLMSENGFGALVLATSQNLQYFTGVTEPSVHTCGIMIIGEQQAQPVLAVLWTDQEAAQEQVGDIIVETYTPTTRGKVVVELLKRLDMGEKTVAADSRALSTLEGALTRSLLEINLVDVSIKIEEEIRSVKSVKEIEFIKRACEVADEGMSIAAKSLRPGITELEIAYLAEQKMIELGSDRMRHLTSVASGPRTKLVHAFATRKKIEAGEMVAIDIGAVIQGYCSDLARTFVVGGPNGDLKAAFGVFRDAQDQILQELTVGKAIDEVQALPRDVVKAAGYPMVGHIGHNIGLSIEEHPFLMGAVTPDPEAKTRENNVLAFFQGSIKREGIVNLGIRLEDTVLVTTKGACLLTSYPRELTPV